MLTVIRVHLPSDIPIAGCELSPYVLLRRPDYSVTTDDIPKSSPIDGYYLRCCWYQNLSAFLSPLDSLLLPPASQGFSSVILACKA